LRFSAAKYIIKNGYLDLIKDCDERLGIFINHEVTPFIFINNSFVLNYFIEKYDNLYEFGQRCMVINFENNSLEMLLELNKRGVKFDCITPCMVAKKLSTVTNVNQSSTRDKFVIDFCKFVSKCIREELQSKCVKKEFHFECVKEEFDSDSFNF